MGVCLPGEQFKERPERKKVFLLLAKATTKGLNSAPPSWGKKPSGLKSGTLSLKKEEPSQAGRQS